MGEHHDTKRLTGNSPCEEFSGKAGQLRYEKARSDTYLSGDINGDKVADFTIHLDDRLTFSKGYFIL
jgi:serralysin